MEDKKNLRRIYRNIRNSIRNKKAKDSVAANRMLHFLKAKKTDLVLLYASIDSEPETDWLIGQLISVGITVALPRCMEDGIMNFHIIDTLDKLKPGKYGIREPDKNGEIPEITDNTVCIVPGLAFTESGGRLGYGGGYYDRFTASYPRLYTVGLTYEELIVSELPVMPHDLRVDAIVTEERMVLCSAE